jgi:hypothetical protein
VGPIQFQREFLGRKLWAKQQQICRAVAEKRSVSVKGCHASGKTFVVSGLVPWWLLGQEGSVVITISPTLRQVKLMWNEIAMACAASPVKWPELTTTGLQISNDNYAIGFSSSKGVNAQGFHAKRVLIITDESPGISADVWDAIEGIRAGGDVHIVKLGNPTVSSGPFFDDFGRGRGSTECITISAFDTPNLAGVSVEQLLQMDEHQLAEGNHLPFLAQRHWVKDKYLRWGPGNPRYVSRVLGEFPTQSEHAVFSLEWIERAKREPSDKEKERAKGMAIQFGVDVAGPGDDETAACARVGGIIIARASWPDKDPRGAVVRWLAGFRKHTEYRMGPVVVDIVGIGYNFALHLADQGFPVVGFNAGHSPIDPTQFLNQKSESYFRLREGYKEGEVSHLPEALDDEKEAQLCGINYWELPNGRIQIEPKDEARKRGIASPDRAEAEMMAFCRIVPKHQILDRTVHAEISPI